MPPPPPPTQHVLLLFPHPVQSQKLVQHNLHFAIGMLQGSFCEHAIFFTTYLEREIYMFVTLNTTSIFIATCWGLIYVEIYYFCIVLLVAIQPQDFMESESE